MITFKNYITEISKPAGNYVSINVDGAMYAIPDIVSTGTKVQLSKQHVTLMYSQFTHLDHSEILRIIETEFPVVVTAQGYEFDSFDSEEKDTSTIVLKLNSDILNSIHTRLIALGCRHSYPDYKPHITFWYNVNKDEAHLACKILNKTQKLPFDVRLAGYKSEPIIDDWAESL